VKVEVWSDVVCPWCYIGKRQLEAAVEQFAHGHEVSVEWKSFELDPTAPATSDLAMSEILQRKYGMTAEQVESTNQRITGLAAELGLEYHLDKVQAGNTFDAHRLIHLAGTHGLGDAMKERLMAAYFSEARPVGDKATIAELAAEVGLDPTEVDEVLAGDRFSAEVRHDEARARALGATGVPFFVIDEAYGVSGAQPAEVLLSALDQAWTASHPLSMVTGSEGPGEACPDGSCPV
jgi:predicted DsbA family dithiol-disulfide isomerase